MRLLRAILRAIHRDALGIARIVTAAPESDGLTLAVRVTYPFALVTAIPLTLMVAVLDPEELDR